jgi:hypothetical protein
LIGLFWAFELLQWQLISFFKTWWTVVSQLCHGIRRGGGANKYPIVGVPGLYSISLDWFKGKYTGNHGFYH